MTQKIAIASDHAGYEFKENLKAHFADQVEWLDLGTNSLDAVDYPEYGQKMGEAIKGGKVERGIVICGSGIGISIAANRYPELRSALCMNTTMARLARSHNDANVLALGARLIGAELAVDIVKTFMNTEFEGGRHQRRVDKMS